MKILAIGDIVGENGLKKLRDLLPTIIEKENIDFTVVNAENTSGGMGLNERDFTSIQKMKINCLTMGNHTWGKKDIFSFIDNEKIIRPANYSKGLPGRGYNKYECKGKKIAVINLIGRVDINVLSENPFIIAKEIINKIQKELDMIFVDFHAEATAEKIAMGNFLDDKVTAVFGTHTHVQTADEKILPNGTGYITDIGMTGPKNSVIGMDIKVSIKRFETTLPERYKIATGECMLNAGIFDIDDERNKVKNIKRINI